MAGQTVVNVESTLEIKHYEYATREFKSLPTKGGRRFMLKHLPRMKNHDMSEYFV